MNKIPSDLSLLEEIYNRYHELFKNFSKEKPNRISKIYMPIDIDLIAKNFNTDADIIFGRLYYHLEKKYGYKNEDGSIVHFFILKIETNTNINVYVINFPLMTSILSGMIEESNRQNTAMFISIMAVFIALLSLVTNIFRAIH